MVDWGSNAEQSVKPKSAFEPGDRVRHQNFGDGVVDQVRETGGQYQLFVRFERTAIWVPGLHVRKLSRGGLR